MLNFLWGFVAGIVFSAVVITVAGLILIGKDAEHEGL